MNVNLIRYTTEVEIIDKHDRHTLDEIYLGTNAISSITESPFEILPKIRRRRDRMSCCYNLFIGVSGTY